MVYVCLCARMFGSLTFTPSHEILIQAPSIEIVGIDLGLTRSNYTPNSSSISNRRFYI